MRLRQVFFPSHEWYARQPARTSVNLTRTSLATVVSPVVLVVLAVVFTLTADGRWTRAAWLIVGLGALVLAAVRIRRTCRRSEEMLLADELRFVYAKTRTGRIPVAGIWSGQVKPGTDERVRVSLRWNDVLATAATPTGAVWWAWWRPRVQVDLFVTGEVRTDDMRDCLVDVDPPSADLPRTRLRFTVPRFSQQPALNLLRWYAPHLLVDPSTGGSVLFLEPDGNPWPDARTEALGSRVPIPPGPILELPPASVPVTEWAPPEPVAAGVGRPEFESEGSTPAGAPVPLRRRPPHVAVFGHLGRITGAGRAWRIGWLVFRLLTSLALLLVCVLLDIAGLTSIDSPRSFLVVSGLFTLWFALGVWRYGWRLLRLRDAAASFVAFTPGGVRMVDAASYASIPWRVISQATLHTEGRRSWLCLAIDADVPADISWAVLRAPAGAQILPGSMVLWLRLPKDEADPRRLGHGLRAGGGVPFDAGSWPGPMRR